jgi:hypothetical protein
MVARPGQYQPSLNAGELAPNVWGRSDVKQTYSGASLMQNAEPVPQGGFAELPGTREAGQVRRTLSVIAYTTPGFNGGPHAAQTVLMLATLTTPQPVAAVDIVSLFAGQEIANAVAVEYSADGVTWLAFAAPLKVTTTARTRRLARPPTQPVMASHIRLRLAVTPPSSTLFSAAALTLYGESATNPTVVREFEHTYSADDAFTVVLTPGHGDVWKGDTHVAALVTAVTADMLPELAREQRLDTMILTHVDLATARIMRVDSDADWSYESASFDNMPLVDYGGSYGNVVNDIWTITLQWSAGPAFLAMEVGINGETSAAVTLPTGPDWATFVANLKTAIEALPSVGPGITVVNDPPGTNSITIYLEFSGAGNAGQRFAVVPRVTNVTTAAAIASHTQFGDPGGEAIMSSLRGWPAAAGFHQDRLCTGGFKSEAGAVLASVTGEYFDLNTKLESASGAILFRLDTSGAERVRFLVAAKHLVIFTSDAEYYVSDRALVRGTPPNVPRSSRNGIAAGIRPVENEGGLIYVGRSRSIIFTAQYSDVSQSYESEPISLLASHLVQGVRNVAVQRASMSTDAARLWCARDDGTLTVGVMIRNQDVMAFVRWQTSGLVRDVCVDGSNTVYLLVERTVGATTRIFRERVSDEALLHQEKAFTFGSPQTLVTGLDLFEGQEVWAMADGYADGPHTVTAGQITLGWASTSVTVGRWTAPIVDTLPLPRLVGDRTQLARPVRVHTVRGHSQGSTSLAVGANGGQPRDVPLLKGGQASDQPVQPFHGEFVRTGIQGWTPDGIVRFTQLRPGRFRIRNFTIEARV